ncbi:uncharacterized protein [Leptinotarsa decemlineata]|uniref:uncharacterized protein n=1 Tax=Leptinotarsa decemlineata TaxID=7539 RepID=UPI003D307D2D
MPDPQTNLNPSYYGQVREFRGQDSDWVIYKRRLDNYFQVNDIDDDKKKAILLNALDEDSYKLIYNLCLPKFPEEKSYQQLTELFSQYFEVSESLFVARSKFFAAFKNQHESANEWAAGVRNLAINCEFEETVIDMMLRDRFIVGFDKGSVQSKLFRKKSTSKFAVVLETALAEMASEDNYASRRQPFIGTRSASCFFKKISADSSFIIANITQF